MQFGGEKRKMKVRNVKLLIALAVVFLTMVLGCSVIAATDFGCLCHYDEGLRFQNALHYTGEGMKDGYKEGAGCEFNMDIDEYYEDWNCSKCHATTCDVCHGDYGTDGMPHGGVDHSGDIETCIKCHGSKQGATFRGIIPGNGKMPVVDPDTPHPADLHYDLGFTCMSCHNEEEMHGADIECGSMKEAVTTSCEDCHKSSGTVVDGMEVTQFSTKIPAHEVHGDRFDCIACHTSWSTTCVGCHLGDRTGTEVKLNDFQLGVGADGKVTTFMRMDAEYEGETHTAYVRRPSHTTTRNAKDCVDCHNEDTGPKIFCMDCEGQLLEEGSSFLPRDIIDWLISMPQAIIDRITGEN